MSDEPPRWDAVVVAGGTARRMGGADKLMLDVGGRPLLERVVAVTADAARTIVVGPQRPLSAPVVWCREDPPGGGPAAAVAAGLTKVDAPLVVLLAGDLALLDRASLQHLLSAVARDADGAVALDDAGEPQWLCSAWRTDVARDAALAPHVALRHALAPLAWVGVSLDGARTIDCDTPDDLRRARELAT